MMEAVNTEVRLCTEKNWESILGTVLQEKGIRQLLYGSKTTLAEKLRNMCQRAPATMPELVDYQKPVEESKDLLLRVDASITTTRGGIAETGSSILWTTPDQPRMMSLILTIQLAILYAGNIYNTFWEAVNTDKWTPVCRQILCLFPDLPRRQILNKFWFTECTALKSWLYF